MVGTSAVVLLRGAFSAPFGSPYVDAHGEPDVGLKRGKPLRLAPRRYAVLRELWARGGVGREVTRVRAAADSYIIQNHY